METWVRQWGEIHGDPVGLFPCLWLGFAAEATSWWPPDWHRDWKGPGSSSNMKYSDALKPGQFVFLHQYAGTACFHVTLAGVILPLATCTDPAARSGLLGLTEKYYDDPFSHFRPDLDDLRQLRDDLLAVGPLDCTAQFRDSGEAFLTFACSPRSYRWIADRFETVMAVLDNDQDGGVEIRETGKLPGRSLAEFARWMSGPGGPCLTTWLMGALAYENSD